VTSRHRRTEGRESFSAAFLESATPTSMPGQTRPLSALLADWYCRARQAFGFAEKKIVKQAGPQQLIRRYVLMQLIIPEDIE